MLAAGQPIGRSLCRTATITGSLHMSLKRAETECFFRMLWVVTTENFIPAGLVCFHSMATNGRMRVCPPRFTRCLFCKPIRSQFTRDAFMPALGRKQGWAVILAEKNGRKLVVSAKTVPKSMRSQSIMANFMAARFPGLKFAVTTASHIGRRSNVSALRTDGTLDYRAKPPVKKSKNG